MSIAETFLAEFHQESQTTRKFLERVPQDKLTWKPHEKSMTVGQLALHIAMSQGQVIQMARSDESPPPNFGQPNPQPESVSDIINAFEESIRTVQSVLPTFSDFQMQALWRLKADGRELMAMPRSALIRMILLNHIYHHRGQLGVYLRMLGAKVPSSYGPSGDEMPDFMQS